jgi:hypothetical protein
MVIKIREVKMNKRKIMMFSFVGIFLVALVSAGILSDGMITRDEVAGLSNAQIGNYMEGKLDFVGYKVVEDNFIDYWNITYLEPAGMMINPETNESEKYYREFTQAKPFKVSKDLYQTCLDLTSAENCKDVLRWNPEPYNWTRVENNETVTTMIKSTYLQAYEEQEGQFERAKLIRDNADNNILEDLN